MPKTIATAFMAVQCSKWKKYLKQQSDTVRINVQLIGSGISDIVLCCKLPVHSFGFFLSAGSDPCHLLISPCHKCIHSHYSAINYSGLKLVV